MRSIKAGDCVSCRIKDSKIVSSYASFDEEEDFRVIGVDESGYYLYVPDYLTLKDSMMIRREHIKMFDLDPKFLDCKIAYIKKNMVSKIKSIMDGEFCINCEEFFYQAEPNQEDGTLICYSCRMNPYR